MISNLTTLGKGGLLMIRMIKRKTDKYKIERNIF